MSGKISLSGIVQVKSCTVLFICETILLMGIVYFLHAGKSNLIKIGFTKNLKERLAKLATGSPEPLTLLKTIQGTIQSEVALLAIFNSFRKHGEWFEMSAELINFIHSLQEDQIYLPHDFIAR